MKTILALGVMATVSMAGLIFEDNFDKLNFKTWQHEQTLGGGGNWEFEWYRNNRTNSFVKDGVLHLQPSLTSEAIGENTMKTGDLNIWGGSPADMCTANNFYGCERNAAGSGNYINPVSSARLRSVHSFGFTYGKVEIVAQLPKGDWLWPAIWLLPVDNEFGPWPASGEIDLVESAGNTADTCPGNNNSKFGSTLHWGPAYDEDPFYLTHEVYTHDTSLADDMHTYGLMWTEDRLFTYIDSVDNIVLDVDLSTQSFWEKGGWTDRENPWVGEPNNAPFNRDFYIVFNVAVGGTNDYFPDGECGKPWTNDDPHSVNTFWNAKEQWYPSWNYPASNDAALKIDSVKVWSLDDLEKDLFMQ